ncbi:unnamed protein product [Alopecurus aequalis]
MMSHHYLTFNQKYYSFKNPSVLTSIYCLLLIMQHDSCMAKTFVLVLYYLVCYTGLLDFANFVSVSQKQSRFFCLYFVWYQYYGLTIDFVVVVIFLESTHSSNISSSDQPIAC